ncbi:CLUMA_CG000624, isoform A [Clunio marinus]|uniref:CLUMA_CG000624, isoform A n=1 Tax=Clunio marinus TaxID=568069 RepID=A0A1J1HKM8_9DIPT|nr:CLUMA_CG000624, isoform A [Clunio marinus]
MLEKVSIFFLLIDKFSPHKRRPEQASLRMINYKITSSTSFTMLIGRLNRRKQQQKGEKKNSFKLIANWHSNIPAFQIFS